MVAPVLEPLQEETRRERQYRRRVRRLLRQQGRWTAAEIRRMLDLLDQARGRVVAGLLLVRAESWRAAQLEQLRREIDRAAADLVFQLAPTFQQGLRVSWEHGLSFHLEALGELVQLQPGPAVSLDQLAVLEQVGSDLVVQVSGEFRNRARRALSLGILSGRSPTEIVGDVADLLRTEPDRQTRRLGPIASQAATIVRTELHGAFSVAAAQRELQLAQQVPDLEKYWLAVHDGRTRDDHAAAGARYEPGGDPGPIPVGQDYLVGGEPAQYPHDPRLSARQRVNCRCVSLLYRREWFARNAR